MIAAGALIGLVTAPGAAIAAIAPPGAPVPAAAAMSRAACATAHGAPRTVPHHSTPAQHPRGRQVIGGDTLGASGLVAPAGVPALPDDLTAESWIVADLDTGEVLGACAPHLRGEPASVQKLLLAATMLPRLDPSQIVTVTGPDMDFEPGSSAVGLVLGGKYSVRTLWLGLLLNSGNDAANVLARLGGGAQGAAGGVAEMNATAQRLGAYDTHAATPSGLDGPGQATSSYDLALIARDCFARADFREYVSTRTATIPAQPDAKAFAIQNDVGLLYQYPGALGGKTGYTDLAQHTFVGAAERDGRRLVVTLLGAEASPARGWQQGASLLTWGFRVGSGTAVGHLVTPEEIAPPAADPVTHPAAANGASAAAGGHGWHWPALVTAATVCAIGLVVIVGARIARRRTIFSDIADEPARMPMPPGHDPD